jgi:hypothetical protein
VRICPDDAAEWIVATTTGRKAESGMNGGLEKCIGFQMILIISKRIALNCPQNAISLVDISREESIRSAEVVLDGGQTRSRTITLRGKNLVSDFTKTELTAIFAKVYAAKIAATTLRKGTPRIVLPATRTDNKSIRSFMREYLIPILAEEFLRRRIRTDQPPQDHAPDNPTSEPSGRKVGL